MKYPVPRRSHHSAGVAIALSEVNDMNKSALNFREVKREELESIVARARTAALSEQDCQQLRAAVEALVCLTQLVQDKRTTIEKLRRVLF